MQQKIRLCGEKPLNYQSKKIKFQNPYLSSNSDLYDFQFLPVWIKKIDNIISQTGRIFPNGKKLPELIEPSGLGSDAACFIIIL